MLRIGLTGGIGSGKSTVASLFAGHGAPIVDTDHIARKLVQPGMPAHADIVSAFGTAVLDADGNLDRTAMRTRVFADPVERERLETILHPRIREEALRQLAGLNAPYALVVVPLLIETGFDALTDRILVVDCAEEAQVERTVSRSNMPASNVRAIMATQASRAQRLARADDVIHNQKGLTELEQQVAQLHQRYLALAHG